MVERVAKHQAAGVINRPFGVSWSRVPPPAWYNIGVDNRQRVKRSPGLDGTGGREAAEAVYLSDPSFAEENDGPLVENFPARYGRSPSRRQIKARCKAILAAYPRPMVGEATEPYEFPVIAAPQGFDIDKVA